MCSNICQKGKGKQGNRKAKVISSSVPTHNYQEFVFFNP
jgi:hypothetical protein